MEIYEKDWRYTALRPYVDAFTKASYSSCEIVGQGNIPQNGAVILAPNHCNALMDALVVLRSGKRPIAFGARADIFKKKTNARMLSFLKILPLVRRRDGLRNVSRNVETIDRIVEIMDHNIPFCLFPEGTHRTKHSLLPIGKTPLRLALKAMEAIDPSKPVYIQPVAIEYGDYFRYRNTCLLTFPEPIDVRAELKNIGAEHLHEAELHRHFSELIARKLMSGITYIPDDEWYDGRWALLKALRAGSSGNLEDRLRRNQQCLSRMLSNEKEKPERMYDLYRKAEEFEQERLKAKISIHSFGKELSKKLITKTISALVLLPIFVLTILLVWPALLTASFTKNAFKDTAFKNTACMVVNLAATPILTLVWAVIFFVFQPWYWALAGTLLTIASYPLFYEILEFLRIYVSDWRLLFNSRISKMYRKLVA